MHLLNLVNPFHKLGYLVLVKSKLLVRIKKYIYSTIMQKNRVNPFHKLGYLVLVKSKLLVRIKKYIYSTIMQEN